MSGRLPVLHQECVPVCWKSPKNWYMPLWSHQVSPPPNWSWSQKHRHNILWSEWTLHPCHPAWSSGIYLLFHKSLCTDMLCFLLSIRLDQTGLILWSFSQPDSIPIMDITIEFISARRCIAYCHRYHRYFIQYIVKMMVNTDLMPVSSCCSSPFSLLLIFFYFHYFISVHAFSLYSLRFTTQIVLFTICNAYARIVLQ